MRDKKEDNSKIISKDILVKNQSKQVFKSATPNLGEPLLPDPLLGTAKMPNDDTEGPVLKKNALKKLVRKYATEPATNIVTKFG